MSDLTEWEREQAAKLPPLTDELAAEAGRLAAEIDARIKAVVDAAPPLSPEQLDRLAQLLPAPTEDRPS